MRGRREERIESALDHIAAALFGLAAGWIGVVLPGEVLTGSSLAVCAGASAAIGYILVLSVLRRVGAETPHFELRAFQLRDLEADVLEELLLTEQVELLLTEQVELILTDADRLPVAQSSTSELLVLDNILDKLGPDSRVVRLFDPAAMPSPGQLDARIERHLRDGTSQAAPPDASQALHEALADLRRSLR
jgi:hypothetical protein